MGFGDIAMKMRRHYNSDARKLSLQSEMDSLDLATFMQKHEITDFSMGLKRLVDSVNGLAPQLFHGFGDGKHKIRYLRRAVMSFDWARNPLSQITTSQYSFDQFVKALNKAIQLQAEISRTRTTGIDYGQYLTHPSDAPDRHGNYGRRTTRWSPRLNPSLCDRQYSRSPLAENRRNRSQSFSRHRNDPHNPYQGGERRRTCWGRGSPDHTLSDRKCIPSAQQIKTHIISWFGCNENSAQELASQFATLFNSSATENNEKSVAKALNSAHITEPSLRNTFNVQFDQRLRGRGTARSNRR